MTNLKIQKGVAKRKRMQPKVGRKKKAKRTRMPGIGGLDRLNPEVRGLFMKEAFVFVFVFIFLKKRKRVTNIINKHNTKIKF